MATGVVDVILIGFCCMFRTLFAAEPVILLLVLEIKPNIGTHRVGGEIYS